MSVGHERVLLNYPLMGSMNNQRIWVIPWLLAVVILELVIVRGTVLDAVKEGSSLMGIGVEG
jgi:hypothetical protein